MKSALAWTVALAGLCALVVACGDDDGGPAGLQAPGIDFVIVAPTELPTKATVDVEIQITEARAVQFPLAVEVDKANVGEEFIRVGGFIMLDEDDRRFVARVPVLMDPRIRVTVSESGVRALSVSKTIAIDVLDFP